MKIALGIVVALALLLAGFTWWALEWSGVAVIETEAPDGTQRSTHVWYIEPAGELWLEAGTPDNGWFLDIQRNRELQFSSQDRSGRFTAKPVVEADAHEMVRTLTRQKYGIRDAWVGLFVDSSESIAVRLLPVRR